MKSTLEIQKQGAEFLNLIYQKSWSDNSFKKKIIADPMKIIENLSGKPLNLPNEKNKILVEDQSNNSIIYLNIPCRHNQEDIELELTDEQLELVAGGETVVFWTVTAAAAFVLGVAISLD